MSPCSPAEKASCASWWGAVGLSKVVRIHAIGGMAGVGKTALAVHAAYKLAPQFPDGQVFLPLHGHTPGQRPVDPAEALASLLRTAGVTPQQIPPDLEARMGLWRHHLADKKLLLLLDDAVGSEQVRPLLPGAPGSLVLVTSRRHLVALEDSQAISLDTLPPDEARLLFARLAARPDLEPTDPAIEEAARLCGYLPLALGMMARQLHHHPAWTTADLAADLATARDRLGLMAAENLSVAAAFDLSYQACPRNSNGSSGGWDCTRARTSTGTPPPPWMTADWQRRGATSRASTITTCWRSPRGDATASMTCSGSMPARSPMPTLQPVMPRP